MYVLQYTNFPQEKSSLSKTNCKFLWKKIRGRRFRTILPQNIKNKLRCVPKKYEKLMSKFIFICRKWREISRKSHLIDLETGKNRKEKNHRTKWIKNQTTWNSILYCAAMGAVSIQTMVQTASVRSVIKML